MTGDITFSDTQVSPADDVTFPVASLDTAGIVQLTDATDSTSLSLAATANAAKKAFDRGNLGVSGADQAQLTANQAKTTADAALPKSGGDMTGDLTLGTDKITLDASGGAATFGSGYKVGIRPFDGDTADQLFIDKTDGTRTFSVLGNGSATFAGTVTGQGSARVASAVSFNTDGSRGNGQNALVGYGPSGDAANATFIVKGNGTTELGDGNITLNADGSASFAGNVLANGGVTVDGGISLSSGLYYRDDSESYGVALYSGGSAQNNRKVFIKTDGSATFKGDVAIGNDAVDDIDVNGIQLANNGAVHVRRFSDPSNPVFAGYSTVSGSTPTCMIASNGSITADGDLTLNGTGNGEIFISANTNGAGGYYRQKLDAGATGGIWRIMDSSGDDKVTINADGSATFAGGLETQSFLTVKTDTTNANYNVLGVTWNGGSGSTYTSRAEISASGAATLAGTVTSGGNPANGAARGTSINEYGTVRAANTSGSIFEGYTVATEVPTSQIFSSGAAKFAGNITSGAEVFAGPGTNLNAGGNIFIQAAANDSSSALQVVNSSDLNNPKVKITHEGAASFAGDQVSIASNANVTIGKSGAANNASLNLIAGAVPAAASYSLLTGVQNDGTSLAFNLKADGSATFAGGNINLFATGEAYFAGTVDVGDTATSGIRLSSSGSATFADATFTGRITTDTIESLAGGINLEATGDDKSIRLTSAGNISLLPAKTLSVSGTSVASNQQLFQQTAGAPFNNQTVNVAFYYPKVQDTVFDESDTTTWLSALDIFNLGLDKTLAGSQNPNVKSIIGLRLGNTLGSNTWSGTGEQTNYGVLAQLSDSVGRKNFNFAASGTARNYFVGSTGIGNIDPQKQLDVTGQSIFAFSASGNGSEVIEINRQGNSAGTLIKFSQDGTTAGNIRLDGSGGVTYNDSASDYRLKENVTNIESAASLIKNMRPVNYNYTSHPGTTRQGFIAHELQQSAPLAVTGTKDATEAIGTLADDNGTVLETAVVKPEELTYTEDVEVNGVTTQEVHTNNWTATGTQPVYQSVDQTKLIPLLTKALQEALERIEALEAASDL
jgi:hypothetical protein